MTSWVRFLGSVNSSRDNSASTSLVVGAKRRLSHEEDSRERSANPLFLSVHMGYDLYSYWHLAG